MSTPIIRVGVIGAGIMGADHARILHGSISGATLSRITDVDPARAQAVADALAPAQVSPDAATLMSDPEVDAVLIASSDDTHGALILACLAAGKPVLCEKPLTPTLDESIQVAQAVAADGRGLVSMGFMRRFDPGFVAIKQGLGAGEHGAALMMHCSSRGVSADTTSEYPMYGSAVHDFDVVAWVLGCPVVEVCWVPTKSTSLVTGMHDPQLVLLRSESGVVATVESFLNARYGYDMRCEVLAETGAFQLSEPVVHSVHSELSLASPYAPDWRPRFATAYRLQSQAWIDSIIGRADNTLATVADGLAASAVAQAAITSMHAGGGWVYVDHPQIG